MYEKINPKLLLLLLYYYYYYYYYLLLLLLKGLFSNLIFTYNVIDECVFVPLFNV